MELNSIQFTLNSTAIRFERMEDREYIACPMSMITEGVHNGSLGPLYYPETELSKAPLIWNHKPVVVYHPQINGKGVSACDPVIVDTHKIGVIMNTDWDSSKKKLRAEAWIEPSRANKIDNRVMLAIENGSPMELSTGLLSENELNEGVWNGEEYKAVAKNIRPDHLALLPDQIGACSMADGAGFLVANALSFSDTRAQLHKLLRVRFGNVWIEDVFSKSVVFEIDAKLMVLSYSTKNNIISLGNEDPVEVNRNIQYRTTQGTLVGNSQKKYSPRPKKELLNTGFQKTNRKNHRQGLGPYGFVSKK